MPKTKKTKKKEARRVDVSPTGSATTLGKFLGLTPARIRQLAQEKIIVRVERGKFDLIISVRNYLNYIRETASSGNMLSEDLLVEKKKLIALKNEKAEIELNQLKENLVWKKNVDQIWGEICSNIRNQMLALPQKLAPQLVHVNDIKEVNSVIKEHVYECLTCMSKEEDYAGK